MTVFLDRDDVLVAAAAALGTQPAVADYGLLDSAVARPRATAFGLDAYPTLLTKAAALMQSLARNHSLVDGKQADRVGRSLDVPHHQWDRAVLQL